ncbi:hypothetical protein KP509_12G025800 [Ceratopteris richardii]|uniref:Uncharacterized protein n=1 Tax=Ceratopteris richardii TaxID=49495 RepID=A0A8T2TJH6_CERRI|nr:hypothetical protein KP509_12G025800 [Ceratopteris richardii]
MRRIHIFLITYRFSFIIQLPGRTDNELKNFWNTRAKRLKRAGLALYPPFLSLGNGRVGEIHDSLCNAEYSQDKGSQKSKKGGSQNDYASTDFKNGATVIANNPMFPSQSSGVHEISSVLQFHSHLMQAADMFCSQISISKPRETLSQTSPEQVMHQERILDYQKFDNGTVYNGNPISKYFTLQGALGTEDQFAYATRSRPHGNAFAVQTLKNVSLRKPMYSDDGILEQVLQCLPSSCIKETEGLEMSSAEHGYKYNAEKFFNDAMNNFVDHKKVNGGNTNSRTTCENKNNQNNSDNDPGNSSNNNYTNKDHIYWADTYSICSGSNLMSSDTIYHRKNEGWKVSATPNCPNMETSKSPTDMGLGEVLDPCSICNYNFDASTSLLSNPPLHHSFSQEVGRNQADAFLI